MRKLDNIKRSRLKIAIFTVVFLGILAVSCLFVMILRPEVDTSTIATTSVAGILTVVTMYIGGDSMRKSDKPEEQ